MQHVATLRGVWEDPTQARVQWEPKASEATTTQGKRIENKGKEIFNHGFLWHTEGWSHYYDTDFSVWNQIKK